jgi:ABC-type nitrate/sulfonate/bicarbonate transport system ATPase subunit
MSHANTRLLQALWPFGHVARAIDHACSQQHAALHNVAGHLITHPAPRTCIIGPSGAGKSTLLTALQDQLGPRAIRVDHITLPHRPVAMLSTCSLDHWLSLLARVGLAEAAILATPARKLSLGQQRRLQLALALTLALDQATHRRDTCTLLIDELTSGLDRLTTLGLLGTLIKLTESPQLSPIHLIAAACDEELPAKLDADRTVAIDPMRKHITIIDHDPAINTEAR